MVVHTLGTSCWDIMCHHIKTLRWHDGRTIQPRMKFVTWRTKKMPHNHASVQPQGVFKQKTFDHFHRRCHQNLLQRNVVSGIIKALQGPRSIIYIYVFYLRFYLLFKIIYTLLWLHSLTKYVKNLLRVLVGNYFICRAFRVVCLICSLDVTKISDICMSWKCYEMLYRGV